MATAVVTGASSGIGAAVVASLAQVDFDVVLCARRADRLAEVATAIGPRASWHVADVTVEADVRRLAAEVDSCEVLVCNAGGALGLSSVEALDEEQWRWMYEANVLGVARTVRAFLPALRRSGNGRIVVITSVAAHQTYAGGAGYTAAKHGTSAVVETLRLELLGEPIRVIEVSPGMVETEFSTVRFGGDAERAAGVYAGLTPLSAADIADSIVWAVTRPAHVTVARIDLFPRAQASARDVHRSTS